MLIQMNVLILSYLYVIASMMTGLFSVIAISLAFLVAL